MFYAKNEDGELQSLFSKSKKELHECKRRTFICPECREPLLLRFGPKVTPHFAHYPSSECRRGESKEHEIGKWRLYQWFKKQGIEAELEKYLPVIQQRPDIFFHYRDKQIALEYQCATIPTSEILKRTATYHEANIFPLWIIGAKHLNQKSSVFSATSFLQSLLYFFHNEYRAYFFHPFTSTFAIVSDLKSVTSNKWRGHVTKRSTINLSFPQLFKKIDSPSLNVPDPIWEKLLYTHRTCYQPKVSSEEAQLRQFLYLNHYHFSLIPSIAYLPLRSQITLSCKPFIWQTRFLMKYFLHVPLGSRIHTPPLFGGKTLNHYQADLALEYLEVLQALGYVKKIQGNWVKLKEVVFYNHVEDALSGDKKLIEALRNLHRI